MIAAIPSHASRFSAVVALDRARVAFLRVFRASRTSVAVVARRASSNATQFNVDARVFLAGAPRGRPRLARAHRAGRARARAREAKTRGKDERRGATGAARAHERDRKPHVRGLRDAQPGLGEREPRDIPLPELQRRPSIAGRARELRAVGDDGFLERGTVGVDAVLE